MLLIMSLFDSALNHTYNTGASATIFAVAIIASDANILIYFLILLSLWQKLTPAEVRFDH